MSHPSSVLAPRPAVFYGWWMVAACLTISAIGNALGLFGVSVYLHELVLAHGWSTGQVSGAVTLSYAASAVSILFVGSTIARSGPRPVIACGTCVTAIGVAALGRASEPWHAYAAFMAIGLGWSCLSTTAITTTLAPWFERHQGRAFSIASLGASIGAMTCVPAFLFGIQQIGFRATTLAAAVIGLAILLPLAVFVLKHRPRDIGLFPDGEPPTASPAILRQPAWSRTEAARTLAFRSVAAAFGIGMLVQIGFLTHHVALVAPALGTAGASATVSLTAAMTLAGRLLLARFADRMDVRLTAGLVLLLAAAALAALALAPVPAVLVAGSAVYGLTIGNTTTLSAIIVRREFGAASYGVVYGAAAAGIQVGIAIGPGLYGLLHDAFGGYGAPLLAAAALDAAAAAIVILGGRMPLPATGAR